MSEQLFTTIQQEPRSSYWLQRIVRHAIIALADFGGVALFWELFSIRRDVISRLSIATAYPALFLAAAAMLVGPWNVLHGRRNPVSFDLRRDMGIWAGIMALLHTSIGINVHLRGRPWLYFIDEHHNVRHDLWGWKRHRTDGGTLTFVPAGHLERSLAASSRGANLEITTALDVRGDSVNADARSRVRVRRNGRCHTMRYYGPSGVRLPCSRLRDGGGRSEKREGAHLHSKNRLVYSIFVPRLRGSSVAG